MIPFAFVSRLGRAGVNVAMLVPLPRAPAMACLLANRVLRSRWVMGSA